jgi:hypothetical protein
VIPTIRAGRRKRPGMRGAVPSTSPWIFQWVGISSGRLGKRIKVSKQEIMMSSIERIRKICIMVFIF